MELPREWDLIQHANGITRRAVQLLREDSYDEGALVEAKRSLFLAIRNVRSTNGVIRTDAQVDCLRRLEELDVGMEELIRSVQVVQASSFTSRALPVYRNGRGRPKLVFDRQAVERMVASGLKLKGMAGAFGCGVVTMKRELKRLNIRLRGVCYYFWKQTIFFSSFLQLLV